MPQPKLIHFTEGGPWHGYVTQDYSDLWHNELADLLAGNNPCAGVAYVATPEKVNFEVQYETAQQHTQSK